MSGLLHGTGSNSSLLPKAAALALFLAAIVVLVYREAPANQFHFDDFHNIVDYGPVRMDQLSGEALANAFSNPKLAHRNIPSVTFALDWWRGGGQPAAFLQTNILLHALTALAVFAFARQVLARIRPDDPRIVLFTAFSVSVLWAVHPINSQAVNLIVQRMAILATLFTVLSLSCYLVARSGDSQRRMLWYMAAAAFALVGAFSKENAWILPLLVLVVEYGVVRHGQPLVRGRADTILLALPFLAAAMVVLDLALGKGPISDSFLAGYDVRSFTMEERLLTQPRVIVFYLSLVLWPVPWRFSLEHDFAISTSLLDPPATLASLLALTVFVLAALYLFVRPKTRVYGFLLLWPVMTLAIESSFIPLEMVFEHRMYMPMVALAILPGAGLVALQRWRPGYSAALSILLTAVALGLSYSTIQRTQLWQDPLTLNEDAVRKAPGSSRAWNNVGMYRYLGGDQAGAMAALERAIELSDERETKALEYLGAIHLDLGDLDSAESLIARAYRLQPENPELSVLNHMGEVELARKRYASAVRFFDRAIRAAPWKSTYYWNIALAYEGLGACSLALGNWRRYLSKETDAESRREVEQHIAANYGAQGRGCGREAEL